MRPTALILGEDPTGPWTKDDVDCAVGYEIMQRERCRQCGLPVWICHNENVDHFKLIADTCFAQREVDSVNESRQKQSNYKPKLGTKESPEPHMVNGTPLDVMFRENYYKAQYEATHPA